MSGPRRKVKILKFGAIVALKFVFYFPEKLNFTLKCG